jgi:hypothetical protein
MEYYGDIYATVKLRMRIQIEANEEPSPEDILSALRGDEDSDNLVEIIDIVDDEIVEHISIDEIDIHESSVEDDTEDD